MSVDRTARPRPLAEVLVEYSGIVADTGGTEPILNALSDYCTELLGVHGVGVLFITEDGSLALGTANTELGQIVEQLETELGEGPCTDCALKGEQVVVPDLQAVADRYPRFVPAAVEAGVRSIHALPIHQRAGQIGALNVIHTSAVELDPDAIRTVQMLCEVTAAYLANSRAFAEESRTARQLQEALDSRVVIEQAKGGLAERHGISIPEAFERLRGYARKNQRKLRDVAEEVLRGELEL